MADGLDRIFLKYSIEKMRQLHSRIETCMGKLTEEQIWVRGAENSNSAGNLMLHLCGNLRQWIGCGVAGLPDIRERDAEFAAGGGATREELLRRLRATVDETVAVFEGLDAVRLKERGRIQTYDVTVLEAVYHVVEHFSYHTGQIIFATKAFTGEDLGFYAHLNKPVAVEKTP
jgi:uncharacterized damage-inducible protein DinB